MIFFFHSLIIFPLFFFSLAARGGNSSVGLQKPAPFIFTFFFFSLALVKIFLHSGRKSLRFVLSYLPGIRKINKPSVCLFLSRTANWVVSLLGCCTNEPELAGTRVGMEFSSCLNTEGGCANSGFQVASIPGEIVENGFFFHELWSFTVNFQSVFNM